MDLNTGLPDQGQHLTITTALAFASRTVIEVLLGCQTHYKSLCTPFLFHFLSKELRRHI